MSDPDQPVSALGPLDDDTAERLAQHLLRQPHYLIDARRLFRRLHLITQEDQRALTRSGDLGLTGDMQPHPG